MRFESRLLFAWQSGFGFCPLALKCLSAGRKRRHLDVPEQMKLLNYKAFNVPAMAAWGLWHGPMWYQIGASKKDKAIKWTSEKPFQVLFRSVQLALHEEERPGKRPKLHFWKVCFPLLCFQKSVEELPGTWQEGSIWAWISNSPKECGQREKVGHIIQPASPVHMFHDCIQTWCNNYTSRELPRVS